MQAFSDMRRDGASFGAIARSVALVAALVVYESFSTIYYLLPPLFGFCFALAAIKKEPRYFWSATAYILFYESDHSLIFMSGVVFFYIYSRHIVLFLENFIMSRYVIIAVSVVTAYFGYYVLINALYFVFGASAVSPNLFLLYYAAAETIVAMAVLR